MDKHNIRSGEADTHEMEGNHYKAKCRHHDPASSCTLYPLCVLNHDLSRLNVTAEHTPASRIGRLPYSVDSQPKQGKGTKSSLSAKTFFCHVSMEEERQTRLYHPQNGPSMRSRMRSRSWRREKSIDRSLRLIETRPILYRFLRILQYVLRTASSYSYALRVWLCPFSWKYKNNPYKCGQYGPLCRCNPDKQQKDHQNL